MTITGDGPVVLAANQAGNAVFAAATEVTTTFQIQVTLASVSSITAPIAYSVVSGPGTISGNILTVTAPGTVIVRAFAADDGIHAAATDTQSITVSTASKTSQTIAAFATIPTKTFSAATFTVPVPAATSKLPVVLSVLTGPATITGNTVTITGAGTVILGADQAGNATYNPAPRSDDELHHQPGIPDHLGLRYDPDAHCGRCAVCHCAAQDQFRTARGCHRPFR